MYFLIMISLFLYSFQNNKPEIYIDEEEKLIVVLNGNIEFKTGSNLWKIDDNTISELKVDENEFIFITFNIASMKKNKFHIPNTIEILNDSSSINLLGLISDFYYDVNKKILYIIYNNENSNLYSINLNSSLQLNLQFSSQDKITKFFISNKHFGFLNIENNFKVVDLKNKRNVLTFNNVKNISKYINFVFISQFDSSSLLFLENLSLKKMNFAVDFIDNLFFSNNNKSYGYVTEWKNDKIKKIKIIEIDLKDFSESIFNVLSVKNNFKDSYIDIKYYSLLSEKYLNFYIIEYHKNKEMFPEYYYEYLNIKIPLNLPNNKYSWNRVFLPIYFQIY